MEHLAERWSILTAYKPFKAHTNLVWSHVYLHKCMQKRRADIPCTDRWEKVSEFNYEPQQRLTHKSTYAIVSNSQVFTNCCYDIRIHSRAKYIYIHMHLFMEPHYCSCIHKQSNTQTWIDSPRLKMEHLDGKLPKDEASWQHRSHSQYTQILFLHVHSQAM